MDANSTESTEKEYLIPIKSKALNLIVDAKGYEEITNNKYFLAIQLIENLRIHSHGYVIFQRMKSLRGITTLETIYVHKYIAEKFLRKPTVKSGKKVFVHFKNGNKLDCRLANLEWLTMNELRRLQKNRESETGFRGVVREGPRKYKSIIYHEGVPIIIGVFGTALAAAKAFNKRSLEMFGSKAALNNFDEKK